MKALSIRQPYAWLIVNNYKDIENRTWPSKYTGDLLIHASKTIDMAAYRGFSKTIEENPQVVPDWPTLEELKKQTGGIVGTVKMTDCVTSSSSTWFEGPYGFVLEYAKVKPFLPYKGQLGIFNIKE